MVLYEQVICRAIREMRVLTFSYEYKMRSVEPYALYYTKDGDDPLLEAWQLSGGSAVDWRDFHLAKLSAPTITDTHFSKRTGYRLESPRRGRVLCQVV